MIPGRTQSGFSLVELMVSITLGLLILASVLMILANTSRSRNEIDRTAQQIENGRYASQLLTEDLRLAGFYGELDLSAIAAPASLADPCSLNAVDWNNSIPVHLQGYDNPTAAPGTCALANLKSGTDVLVVRRARTCTAGSANCDTVTINEPYLQVSLCATQTPKYKLGLEGSTTFDMQTKACSATLADKREYEVHAYFISTDNGSGQSIPTLKRLELNGTGWDTVPLVEGIEQLQFLYGLDTNNDGAPDLYVADPNDYPVGTCSGTCPRDNWMNTVTVKFYLLARNLQTSPDYVDTKTYALGVDNTGNAITVGPFNDGYRRHVYAGLIRIVNPAARRDTP